jgi:hypothetical protein
LSTLDELATAWLRAAEDLGVSVVAPYQVVDEPSHATLDAIALVSSFGSARGVVVVGRHSRPDPITSIVQAHGQICSFIDEESYSRYDRDLFVATLNDWGWHGDPAKAPKWYTGQPWTN